MIIDVNANLSRWPFRRTSCDELPRLAAAYRAHGVGQAWVGSLDGLFHRDVGGVNLRLLEACRQDQGVELVPFGTVNPLLPDWPEDVRRCAQDYGMPGLRLHPNYHGYRLDEPVFAELLDQAVRRGLIVQLAVRMDDVRVQHPLMRIADVDVQPLAGLVAARSGLRVVLLNALATVHGPARAALAATGRVWFDMAMQEGVGGVASLVQELPPGRVLFGSHLPLFPLESAILKLQEAALDQTRQRALEHDSAARLLGRM